MFEFLNSAKFEKVKIKGFEDIDHKGTPEIFEAFINPDEFTISYNTNIDHTAVIGKESVPGNFLSSTPMELSLKFYLDGTKAAGPIKDKDGKEINVAKKIVEFYNACGYNPERHRPRYVQIFWGELHLLRFDPEVFHGCLKTLSVNYKLFNPDGTPLRAIVNATFIEAVKPAISASGGKPASPDLTHVRVVKEGDTLPAMALKIYGDFSYYLEVARVNGLQDFRNLQPGTKIFFPPFDKKVKTTNTNG